MGLRWEQVLADRTDEDGMVVDRDVETYSAVAEPQCGFSLFELENSGYVAFAIDNGATDIEVRVSFEWLEQMHDMAVKFQAESAKRAEKEAT